LKVDLGPRRPEIIAARSLGTPKRSRVTAEPLHSHEGSSGANGIADLREGLQAPSLRRSV